MEWMVSTLRVRSHDGRQPDDTQKIVWLPGKAYAEAQVIQRASTIPSMLVRQGDRYGLRTSACHAEALHKLHRPDLVYIPGTDLKRYRVGPMPFGSTKQSLCQHFPKVELASQANRPTETSRGSLRNHVECPGG